MTTAVQHEYLDAATNLTGHIWPDGTERISNEEVAARLSPQAAMLLRLPDYRRYLNRAVLNAGWIKYPKVMKIVPRDQTSNARGYWRPVRG